MKKKCLFFISMVNVIDTKSNFQLNVYPFTFVELSLYVGLNVCEFLEVTLAYKCPSRQRLVNIKNVHEYLLNQFRYTRNKVAI